MNRLILAACAAIAFNTAAAADPLTDLLDSVFHGRTSVAALHPHNAGFRRVHLRRGLIGHEIGEHSVVASWYGGGERLNSHTASGERFVPHALTAAHRTLPLGTRVQVCYRGCAVGRINDRGPAAWTGRSLDLSRGFAGAIGMLPAGQARVAMRVLD